MGVRFRLFGRSGLQSPHTISCNVDVRERVDGKSKDFRRELFYREEQPEAVREDMLGALMNGFASHHAGCLPAWKGLIEELYQGGNVQNFTHAMRCCPLLGQYSRFETQ